MVEYYPNLLRQHLGTERAGSDTLLDGPTEEAALIAGRSQSTSGAAKGAEPVNRKERAYYSQQVRPLEESALTAWAKKKGLWVSENDFNKEYSDRKIGAGAEQQVYLSHSGRTVIKVNSGSFHGTWLDYFNRLICHSFLFPSTRYKIIGFTKEGLELAVVTEQPFVILDKGASREKVESFLSHHDFSRTKNDDYYSAELGIILEDLHDENVFEDGAGNLLFIDPVIYLETVDMGRSGTSVFRFPFV